jgi:hypothetical protein
MNPECTQCSSLAVTSSLDLSICRAVFRGGAGQNSQTNFFAHFLGKAKYFITILTKSLCGVAKLHFYHYVRFFLQNLPKLCRKILDTALI